MSVRNRKKPNQQPVPNLHFVMIITVAALSAVCLAAYGIVPGDRTKLYNDVVLLLVGLLAGKLSNSFGKEPDFTPTVSIPDDDGQTKDDENE